MGQTGRFKSAVELDQPYLNDAAQRALANRLARIEGHLRSVRQMVLDHRCADEILLQVSAVKAGLNQCSAALLRLE